MNKIEIKKLKKKYQNFALKDVQFSIPKGMLRDLLGKMEK